MSKRTPAMEQYDRMKEKAGNAILFFRMGDFYEMFEEDAHIAARELGITLTSRGKSDDTPIPLAGIPYHAAERYIAELTRKGYHVAICEQISDPKLPGIVERDIVRIVTPGTTIQDDLLHHDSHNFLAAIYQSTQSVTSACLDVSTGDFFVFTHDTLQASLEMLHTYNPSEIIIESSVFHVEELQQALQRSGLQHIHPRTFPTHPEKQVMEYFGSYATQGLHLHPDMMMVCAVVLAYVEATWLTTAKHIKLPKIHQNSSTMILGEETIRNLELFATQRDGTHEGSLHHLLAKTMTGAGGRLLRQWMWSPLTEKRTLLRRLSAVEECIDAPHLRKECRTLLKNIYDIERLLGKVAFDRANARDIKAIGQSITVAYQLYVTLKEGEETTHTQLHLGQEFEQHIAQLKQLEERIERLLQDELPITVTEGGIIRDGINPEIDELRTLRAHAKEWLMEFQTSQQQLTGISTLRVKYTGAFGYFIEISKGQAGKAPDHYIRRQTLVNAERYVTEELKIHEEKILGSEAKLAELEYRMFQELRAEVMECYTTLQQIAQGIAHLDVITTFADVAAGQKYTKPKITDEHTLSIEQGRHPVIEALLKQQKESFVPNTTQLDSSCTFALITGPNMAGKSTYLRQTALICYMAHIGCFVPAKEATIPMLDRIFTRVGASDNLSKGASTFMIEMQETAYILQHATDRSLIILDELGRGTSTYDGLSLAWAVVEELHDHMGAFALFATHYHELINVVEHMERGKNLSVAVSKKGQHIVFLHKIVPGGASQSYGIEVAKLAGLPRSLILRAQSHLEELEHTHTESHDDEQLSLFHQDAEVSQPSPLDHLAQELLALNPDEMRPIEALAWIAEKKSTLAA